MRTDIFELMVRVKKNIELLMLLIGARLCERMSSNSWFGVKKHIELILLIGARWCERVSSNAWFGMNKTH